MSVPLLRWCLLAVTTLLLEVYAARPEVKRHQQEAEVAASSLVDVAVDDDYYSQSSGSDQASQAAEDAAEDSSEGTGAEKETNLTSGNVSNSSGAAYQKAVKETQESDAAGSSVTPAPTPAPPVCELDLDEVTFIQPVFLQVLNPSESARTYSGTGEKDSMLDSTSAWTPAGEEADWSSGRSWIMIDLGSTQTVAGVVLQQHASEDQYVTTYNVSISLDQVQWKQVKDRDVGTGAFQGALPGQLEEGANGQAEEEVSKGARYQRLIGGVADDMDGDLIQQHVTSFQARFVKVVPTAWKNKPSMRVGVLAACSDGCSKPAA
eukprot:TRINITY_DN111289_c0_g1_i1.p1 TRINITY_DN111289_c0_g1~~TRINITY_DN111289_c0_g1_i1.p1  ORF type:complete len:347 (-),score=62.94 TRINITY_DN111289_c0_g1_i1:84-1043(-)